MATYTLPTTRLGLKQGGSDNLENFLLVAGGEVLKAFEENYYQRTLTMHKSVVGSKGARFPVIGRSKATRHTIGENLLQTDVSDGGINAGKNTTYSLSYKNVTPDEVPYQISHLFNKVDYLMTPEGAMERQAITADMGRAISEAIELTWMSMIMQNAMSVDSLKSAEMSTTFSGDELVDSTGKNFSRLKRNAALKAGLTDSAAATSTTVSAQTFKGNSFGYHIDALSSASAIRSVLFKKRRYYRHLRIPSTGRFCLISADHYDTLAEAAGLYTGSSGPVVEFSNQVNGGGGNVGQVIAPVIAGWSLIPTPYLTGVAGTGLGTQMQDVLNGGSSPTLTDDKRYQLAVAPTSIPSFQNAVVVQEMVQHSPGGAGTQPNAWAEYRDLFDKTAIIFGHSSCIGTAMLHELEVDGRPVPESNGDFMVNRYFCGHSILRPEASSYCATAKVSTT